MRIRASLRGLTFSFKEQENFKVGTKYRYIIDISKNEICIIPDDNGKYKISRKGPNKKPLLDLRNQEIRTAISNAQYIEIRFVKNEIIVHIIKSAANIEKSSNREIIDLLDKSEKESYAVSKDELCKNPNSLFKLLKSSGLFSDATSSQISSVFDVTSLFSGAGLLDYPFYKDNSFNISFACDSDKEACLTYLKNINNTVICTDVRNLKADLIPDCDVVIGGPCCQGYSNANRHSINKQSAKEKRLLIDDYIRIVKEKRPKIFLIENVPQFLTKESGLYLEKVLTHLSDYQITYQIVTDLNVGGYTKRKRVILLGSKIGKIDIPDISIKPAKTVRDALKKIDDSWPNYHDISLSSEETKEKMSYVRPGHNYKDIPCMKHLNRHSNMYRRLSYDEPGISIVNWRKINLMPPAGNRILSVSEASALMGFNKDFKFYGSLNSKQQQVGNGVTYAIASFAKEIIKNALYSWVHKEVLPAV